MKGRVVPHRYVIVEHTADVGIETLGSTLGAVIGNAAYAMFDLMYDLSVAGPGERVEFEVTAASPPELLVDVLSELLARSEIHDVVFTDVDVSERDLHAVVEADAADARGLDLRGPPVKAVTYHELRCEPTDDGWAVRVIFDV